MATTVFSLCLLISLLTAQVLCQCPDDDPTLIPWAPGDDPALDVIINGEGYLLTESANLNTIHVTNGGRLVVQDNGPFTETIQLRVRHILITNNGEFHVGSESCPYMGYLDIVLWGTIGDGGPSEAAFGRKFIGVAPTGAIEMHGAPKVSWTQLDITLPAGAGLPDNVTVIQLVSDQVQVDWEAGSQIVIASSDYDPEHAEVFDVVICNPCAGNQIRIAGTPQYTHYGEIIDGVDMRAEVGLLTRNVKIIGEVEEACYGNPDLCSYFDVDIFGGQTQVLMGFKSARFADIELVNMGQQTLGAYPIHFHRVGAAYGAYAKRLAIHDTRSRCVTLHACEGVLVEDVVGYNSLGHCFFLEDGNEVNNTLRRNLGLVTRAGSLLPHDRNQAMCEGLLGAVEPGYIPEAKKECMHASTFWLTHPDNIVEDNAAAGSEEFGFFLVFHREPTGPSAGTLPPFHSERNPLASFTNNRAHSNPRGGLEIDRGVKITDADADDPREFLAMSDYARFSPHENRDLSQPRVAAVISNHVSYKNHRGAKIRGGDVTVQDSSFVDDTIGVTFFSDNTFPYDIGSQQTVLRSTFIGRSSYFSPDPVMNGSYPQRGVEVREGPMLIDSCTFSNFVVDEYRNVSSAIGYPPNRPGQFSTRNTVQNAVFTDNSLRLWMGAPGTVYGDWDADGAQTQILYDADGSVTGDPQSYVVRLDKDLLNEAGCREDVDFNAAICSAADYGQVYLRVPDSLLTLTVVSRSAVTENPFILSGTKNDDEQVYSYKQYQPVLISGREYNLHWDGVAPDSIIVSPHNFQEGGMVGLALCYPSQTTFTVYYQEWDQLSDSINFQVEMIEGTSVTDVGDDPMGRTYFWNEAQRLLYIKPVQGFALLGSNYCSDFGCQRINIAANIVNQEISDCR